MTDSGSGVYTLPPGYLAVTGQTITASQHNPALEDLAASMNRRYMRDGRAPMLGNVPMNGYKATGAANGTDPQDYVTLAQVQALMAGLGFYPGFMVPYSISSATVPVGWLVANGQSVLRASHPALWAAVQAGNNLAATQDAKTLGQYGPGDGSTTFTLPNLYADNGYFIRPISSGRAIGTAQSDENKSHAHTGATTAAGDHIHQYVDSLVGDGPGVQSGSGRGNTEILRNTGIAGIHIHGLAIDPSGGAETRPKNIAYPVLIKT